MTGIAGIAAGVQHSAAVGTDGTAWAWGGNDGGRLGDGTTADRHAPVQVSALLDARVTAAERHSLAVAGDGSAWAWGPGADGQLGTGDTVARDAPTRVVGLTSVATAAAGDAHSLAAKTDGTAWTWGSNGQGRLGDGTTTNRLTPVQVVGLTGVTAVAAGASHSLALKNDGTVWAWGNNAQGRLGDGTTIDRLTPVPVLGLTGVVAIAAGGAHSMALKSDGTVWAWGANGSGQLGDGTTVARSIAVPVVGFIAGSAIAAGDVHSLAVRSDGTAWAWGNNGQGRLGDGTTTERHTPVQVVGLTGAQKVAAGASHSLAFKSDGTAWAWGNNAGGRLGDGTTTDRLTPVQVAGVSSIATIAAGATHSLASTTGGGSGPIEQTLDYGYDRLYRLISATFPGGGLTTYDYDPVGNRLSMIRGTPTAYTYDRADRILTAGATPYVVNANGNTTGRGVDTFGYDQANRLASATVGLVASGYTYDGDGKRATKTVAAATTSFVYDVNRSLPVVLDDAPRKYVWGLGLAYAVDKTTDLIFAYHTDGLGSVRAITDAAGNVIETYQTDEFGVSTATQGSITQPFQYTGEQRDGETGFIYLRARMYEPGVGRFLQRDPMGVLLGGPIHGYYYVGNNPITFVDPSGLLKLELCYYRIHLEDRFPDVPDFATGSIQVFHTVLLLTDDSGSQLAFHAIPVEDASGKAYLRGLPPAPPEEAFLHCDQLPTRPSQSAEHKSMVLEKFRAEFNARNIPYGDIEATVGPNSNTYVHLLLIQIGLGRTQPNPAFRVTGWNYPLLPPGFDPRYP